MYQLVTDMKQTTPKISVMSLSHLISGQLVDKTEASWWCLGNGWTTIVSSRLSYTHSISHSLVWPVLLMVREKVLRRTRGQVLLMPRLGANIPPFCWLLLVISNLKTPPNQGVEKIFILYEKCSLFVKYEIQEGH